MASRNPAWSKAGPDMCKTPGRFSLRVLPVHHFLQGINPAKRRAPGQGTNIIFFESSADDIKEYEQGGTGISAFTSAPKLPGPPRPWQLRSRARGQFSQPSPPTAHCSSQARRGIYRCYPRGRRGRCQRQGSWPW